MKEKMTKADKVTPSEELECRLLCQWMDAQNITYAHVPNEINDVRGLGKRKALGLAPGFPDYIVLLPGGRAVFTEMKAAKRGKLSLEQRIWMSRLTDLGFECAVCHGHVEATKFLTRFV